LLIHVVDILNKLIVYVERPTLSRLPHGNQESVWHPYNFFGVTGAVGLAGGAVMGTAHLTSSVAKGAVGVTKGAVKGTVKGAAKGAKGMLKIGKRGNKYDYDDDESD